MSHFYFKNGQLAMRSEEPIDAPNLDHVETTLIESDKDLLDQNAPCKLVDGQIQIGTPKVLGATEITDRQTLLQQVQEELGNLDGKKVLTADDLQKIFSKLT